jgi:hypothetical protein
MAPHTGRYQSQLLNVLNRQSQKLKDRSRLLWRHLKLAAVWGTQLVLYPIYAIFQMARIAGRQMGYRMQQFLAPGTPVASEDLPTDFAIQHVMAEFAPPPPAVDLSLVVPFPLRWLRQLRRQAQPPIVDVSLPQPIAVQGLASCLHTGDLVLVSADNRTHDVLTCDQQHQLQQRILWEIANYWYLWRQYLRRKRYLSGTPESLATLPQANWVTPVQWFWQLIAWIQYGPVANRLNLFQEVVLIESPDSGWFRPRLGQLPMDVLTVRWGAMAYGGSQPLSGAGFWESLPEADWLARLIQAALRYFLGQPDQTAVGNQPGTVELPQSAPLMQDAWLDDPWLSPMGLNFSDAEVMATPTSASSTLGLEERSQPESLPPLPDLPGLPPASWRARAGHLVQTVVGRLTGRAGFRPAVGHRLSGRSSGRSVVPTATGASYLQTEAGGDDTLTWQRPSRNAATTTWIDVLATPIGYVKHPLEQLLDALDRALTWLEHQLSALWHRLQRWWVTKQARIKDTIRTLLQR